MDNSQQQNDDSLKTITILSDQRDHIKAGTYPVKEAIIKIKKDLIDFHTSIEMVFPKVCKKVDYSQISVIGSIRNSSSTLIHFSRLLERNFVDDIVTIISGDGTVNDKQKKINRILHIEQGNCIYPEGEEVDKLNKCVHLYGFIKEIEGCSFKILFHISSVETRLCNIIHLILNECQHIRNSLCRFMINEIELQAQDGEDQADKDLT